MPNYQIAYHPTTRVATIQAKGDALPAGTVKVGEFEHADVEAVGAGKPENYKYDENHVFWHHVRDALYKRKASNPAQTAMFPENITDLDRVKLAVDTVYVALTAIEIGSNVTLTVASPTHQIVVTPTPGGASNTKCTFVSSDPTKATVSATGLVTRVANGTAVITATSEDGGFTDTKTITCTA